jgi:hypothetical protein
VADTDPAPETWLDLEKLAARIYAELEPEATVTHDASLRGVLSESERQVDVLIENPSTSARVVVDCKDWKHRADVNDVGRFASLLEDVEATAGVLICNRGFSRAGRSLAGKKGISLCQLHDVDSRKWTLDVLIPVVWTQTQVTDLRVGFRVRLEVGDSIPTHGQPDFRLNGRPVDPLGSFVDLWNRGAFVAPYKGRTGIWRGETAVELVTLEGRVRYALFTVEALVAHRSRLGYLPPRESRGIVDFETGAYQTVRLNATTTLLQQPEGGWNEIGDPSELAVQPRATVLTLQESAGLTVRWRALDTVIRVSD